MAKKWYVHRRSLVKVRLLLCCFSDDMLERGGFPSVYFEDETFENNQYSQYSAEPTVPYVTIMENPMV